MMQQAKSGWQRLVAFQQQRFQLWIGRRIPPSSVVTLNQKRLFIFPTRTGFFFLLCLFVMLITAINYQNNMSFALTFLLANLFVISVLHTYANLAGLTLRAINTEPVFPGQLAEFEIQLEARSKRGHLTLCVGWPESGLQLSSVQAGEQQRLTLYHKVGGRGWFRPPRLLVESTYPLGLLRCWTWIDLDIRAMVYPNPIVSPPVGGLQAETPDGAAEPIDGDDDFFGFRAYRAGDSLRRVHWKGLAKTQQLQTRLHNAYASRSVWLDWDMFPQADVERKLSYLCYWVLQLEQRNEEYGLRIPGVTVAPDVGLVHRDRVLQALALYGEEA